jgi:uncharacterized membrane protein
LRVIRLDFQPLWWDEGYSVWFAHQPLTDMVRLTAADIHPPLYYAILGIWSRALGLAPPVLRLLSVFVGISTIALVAVVGNWLAGRFAGLVAAFLLAINPFHIYYSQEVRMYGLVTLFAVLAVGFSARWLGVAAGARPLARRSAPEPRDRGLLLAYIVAATLGLYAQYYMGLLLVGLTVTGLGLLWRRPRVVGRLVTWLLAQAVVLLLFLPWLLFAGPRLAPYISQKIVADSDRPLGLLLYLARHLSAFVVGHLEGPLVPWWPLGLVGLVLLAWGLIHLAGRDRPRAASGEGFPPFLTASCWRTVLFLGITLLVLLLLGWSVNLSYPFFPERGERLMLVGLPLFVFLVATVLACALDQVLDPRRRTATETASATFSGRSKRTVYGASVFLGFGGLALLSLVAFYTVPRYPEEDYRPLIGQVRQSGRPGDTVYVIYPWQVGYFWSYGLEQGPQPKLASQIEWNQALAQELEEALAHGHVWFPEHLSLGGRLEGNIESYLAQTAYGLANRWYSPSTRLTGWVGASTASQSEVQRVGPLIFRDGPRISWALVRPSSVVAANQAVRIDLNWEPGSPLSSLHASLRLTDNAGKIWSQHDFAPRTQPGSDRVALLVPAGTPPGDYTVRLALSPTPEAAPYEVFAPEGQPLSTEAVLAKLQVNSPLEELPVDMLPFEQPVGVSLEKNVALAGFSASEGPLEPGGDLVVNLFWQSLPTEERSTPEDLFAFVQLIDDDGVVAAGWEGPPVAWHPTSAWQPGELVRSQHVLRLPATLNDGAYDLIAGLFDPITGQRLQPEAALFRPSQDFVGLGVVEILGRTPDTSPPQSQVPLAADMARVGRLVGFDLNQTTVAEDQDLVLTLYWQATELTSERLAVFVHLVDESGDLLAQSDGEPGQGAYPTSSWLPGEYLTDSHRLRVRSPAPGGPSTLVVGMYNPQTGERVPWLDGSGVPLGDTLQLPVSVTVGPS